MSSHRKIKSDQFPKTQTKRRQSTSRASFKAISNYEYNVQLPQLSTVPKSSQEALFVHKVQLCTETFNFLETTFAKEKKLKYNTLKELVVFITEEGNIGTLTESTYRQIVNMVGENLFRTFPPIEYTDYEPEYDEQTQEAAWPHMKLIYDLFLHFINSPEINLALLKKVINRSFIVQLSELFHTEDVRERKCLKNLLLSIYLKFFEQRPFIRRHIRNIFLRYIYEVDQFNGISELLEILVMAINGFNVPLRQEHRDGLVKVLIPLHTPRYIAFYHKPLIDCLKGYIKKEETLSVDIITGLLRYWPKTSSEKQVLFLQEIAELLEVIPNNQFVKFQEPLMKTVARSISSLHFQVAEMALNLWESPDFFKHFNNNVKKVMPIVFPNVYRVSKTHWNSSISEQAGTLLRTFSQIDSALLNSLVSSQKSKKSSPRKSKKK